MRRGRSSPVIGPKADGTGPVGSEAGRWSEGRLTPVVRGPADAVRSVSETG